MAKFYILHLSDLHICDSINITLKKLIKSISENKELVNKRIIIVITGDIINRANYKGYRNTAIEFFNELHSDLLNAQITISDIIIVPGNHDKIVNASNKLFSIAQQSGMEFSKDGLEKPHLPTEKETFILQSAGFEEYISLCNEIFNIFEIKDSTGNIKSYTSTFGIDTVSIDETIILFIRINTAISCYGSPGDQERYHLTVGRYQLDLLNAEYQKIRNNAQIALTFGLAHHPISYIIAKEATKINRFLISETYLNVDFFLSGHIHDGSITNLSNHNRSMISLETGIGWPDDPYNESQHANHRYSLYCFDEEKNIFWSSMYKTNQASDFSIDADYLLTDQEKSNGIIINPLKTRDYAFITLNDYDDFNKQYLFVNSKSIKVLKSLFTTTSKFSSFCTQLISDYLNRYTDWLLNDKDSSDSTRNGIEELFNDCVLSPTDENKEKRFEHFLYSVYAMDKQTNEMLLYRLFIAYLQHVADSFYQYFKDYFDQDSECRAVFRAYDKDMDKYTPIASSPPKITPRSPDVSNNTGQPRLYEYDNSLIESAYNARGNGNKSLIYSINSEKHYFKPDNWDDFMVVIPNTDNYRTRDRRGQYASRPPIVFIFSVRLSDPTQDQYQDKLKHQAHLLYLLQFSEVEGIITSVIERFIEATNINIRNFIDNLRKCILGDSNE